MTPRLHATKQLGSSDRATAGDTRPAAWKTGRGLIRVLLGAALAAASLTVTIPGAPPAEAHRDGCHRWHSCPSDSGSYVCGDLGIATYCPGTEALPEAPPAAVPVYDDVEPDLEAPDSPAVASASAKAGGLVSLALTAEKGSTITVEEDGRTVATKKATGSRQTITFTAPTGTHSYVLTATDAAGNTSYQSDAVSVTADATKPVTTLTAHAPTALEGAARIDVNTEAGASYSLTVTGQKAIVGKGTGATVTHLLWLPNGTYRATVTSTDPAGNITKVARDLTVAIPATLTVTQTSAPFASPVEYRLVGTPRSRGTLSIPGQSPQEFTIDDSGTTILALALGDGTYDNGSVSLTDFAGRTVRLDLPSAVVDTTGPTLALTMDAAMADRGTLSVALTTEEAAKITLTAVRRPNDADPAGAPITATLVGTGAPQRWSKNLPSGTYELTAVALDAAGNQSRQTRTVTVTKPATAGEIAAGLGLLLVLLGLITALVITLWRKRHWIAATGQRRRAAAAARAHRAAVAAAQAEYTSARAGHDQTMAAFHEADRKWKTRQSQLAELITWAAAPLLPHAADTHGLRLRPNEQLYAVLPATLIEERTKQGRPNRVAVASGHAVVTSERVAFRGARNRDWLYSQLEDVTAGNAGPVLMTVSSRKTTSGVRLSRDPAAMERGQLLILRAIRAHQGDSGAVHRDLLDEEQRHTASRPLPPPPLPLPAILQAPSPHVPDDRTTGSTLHPVSGEGRG